MSANFDVDVNEQAFNHQISTSGSGSVAVSVKPYGASDFTPLTVNGVAVSIALGNSFGPFDGNFSDMRFTFSGLVGTADIVIVGSGS